MLQVKEKKTGRTYEVMVQAVDLNQDGHYVMRYNIGHANYTEWIFCHCIYDNDEFNNRFVVIDENYKTITKR